MKDESQVREMDEHVDFIGFIFYPNSKRCVHSTTGLNTAFKVGVFVNEFNSSIADRISSEGLDVVQLHGSESPETCAHLKKHAQIIKAFGIDSAFDFGAISIYEPHVNFFLFDTKTVHHGGSGVQFDWSILENYRGITPFFLSGGINPESVESLKAIRHPQFFGIDLNSGFEHQPGDKNCEALKEFIQQIKD